MTLITEQKFLDPDAPEDYGVGRECTKCNGKVTRYSVAIVKATADEEEILLCFHCEKNRAEDEIEPELFVGRTVKKGRAKRYKLPNLEALRTARHLSRRELEADSDVSRTTIARIEEGEWAGTGVAGKLAQALGVKTEELRGV